MSTNSSIVKVFASIAERYPNKIAIKYKDEAGWHEKKYSELLEKAKNVAIFLLSLGVKEGDPVALESKRNEQLCEHLLGILWAGGHYVFLDATYPIERQRLICKEVGVKIGLYQTGTDPLQGLDVEWHDVPNEAIKADVPEIPYRKNLPAYISFTSGSTGVPKAVVIPHRGVTRLLCNTDYIEFSPNEVYLQLSDLNFDLTTFEIWGPLLNGGTCVIHFETGSTTPAAIKESIETQGVSTLWLTSSLYNAVISESPETLQSIKQLLIGGEALSVAHIRKGLECLPNTNFFNGYGPSENTTFTTVYPIPRKLRKNLKRIPIGFPIKGTSCGVFDDKLSPINKAGTEGELITFGEGLAVGYLNQKQLTEERFVDIICNDGIKRRGYRTGDIVVQYEDGSYDYIKRNDQQVKIDGHRIEPGEIEIFLNERNEILEARVLVREGSKGQKRLAAYVVGKKEIKRSDLRDQIASVFPKFMVPHFIIPLAEMPRTRSGKLNEKELPDPFKDHVEIKVGFKEIAEKWHEVLGRNVSINENFLDAGGTSLEATRLVTILETSFSQKLASTFVFEFPSIKSQTKYFQEKLDPISEVEESSENNNEIVEIAIIGMACKFPGSSNVEEYWDNLLAGKESISFFSQEELDSSIDSMESTHRNYIKAKGVIKDFDKFDAKFFGVSPIEASVIDPQQRIMLELAWHALDDAGVPPGDANTKTGVFVGMNWARYYQQNVLPNSELLQRYGAFNAALANEPDFLSTRISYKLNLKGPSINVLTACSTGLVAISQACASIERGECDTAIAGGVSIETPVCKGYMYQEGGMLSKDGHCRSFDADASGTTFNDGAATVVLKRLDKAKADGDRIYAVVKGYAVNNDGEKKASFTAPSVGGQVDVYNAALRKGRISPESVGFIEAHGTATPMGDPIEVEALRQSYASTGNFEKTCALGSVKSNIGHTIHAAGIAGFIKAVLAVKHNKIPPTLHFKTKNKNIDLENTPFYINTKLESWKTLSPRRAGITSLGVGGTNAHVIVEQFEDDVKIEKKNPSLDNSNIYTLLVSAIDSDSLLRQANSYHKYLLKHEDNINVADMAYTSLVGRKHFNYRFAVSGHSVNEISTKLSKLKAFDGGESMPHLESKIGFLFSGQGSQSKNMGLWLYQNDQCFRTIFDKGSEIVLKSQGIDLREIYFSGDENNTNAVNQTQAVQPALFLLEYGIATYLLDRGCKPDFFIGHSIGEFVAATLAGIFNFNDAVAIVAARGALMQSMPPGKMLVVKKDEKEIKQYCNNGVCLAAINAPGLCVLAGPEKEIESLHKSMEGNNTSSTILHTSHAFHSEMMEPVVKKFRKILSEFDISTPAVPIFSTVTGKQLTDKESISLDYWSTQLLKPVEFSKAVQEAINCHIDERLALVEVGPGRTLTTLASYQLNLNDTIITAALPGSGKKKTSISELSQSMGELWINGFNIDWITHFHKQSVNKISLPGYSFSQDRHWLELPKSSDAIEQPLTMAPIHMNQQNNFQEQNMTEEQHTSHIQQQLVDLLEEVTGFDLTTMSSETHFGEVGLDSLLLTQVATAIDRKFDVGITFRHLVEDYTCLGQLSEYVAAKTPVETVTVPVQDTTMSQVAAPATVATLNINAMGNSGASDNNLQTLINSQLQIMQLQLQTLSGGVATNGSQPALPNMPASAPIGNSSIEAAEIKAHSDKNVVSIKSKQTPGTRITRERLGVNLSNAQQEWIDGILKEYQNKFSKSKIEAQKHRKYFADPRTVSGFNPQWKEVVFPIVTERSSGSKLWDIDGNEFIDTANGFGPILFGHSPNFVTEAIKNQLDKGIETGPQSPIAGEVAKLFCELTGNERCTFASTGSEAVMGALRLARTVTGRPKVVMFEDSYHGIFDEVVNRVGQNYQALPAAPGINKESTSNMLVLPWGDSKSLDIIKELGTDLAAVLVEPVQSRTPEFHDADYIQALRKVTTEIGSALILDEVVTGFRVGPGGIRKRFDIDADLTTYGKVVGGGLPIGIIGGKAKFMDALDGGFWEFGDDSIPESGVTFFAGTFVRHPLALVAAKAILGKIKSEGEKLYSDLETKTSVLANDAKTFIGEMNCGITFEEFASLFYVSVPSNAHWGHMLFLMMQMEGIHIQQYRPNFLTTEHSDNDVLKILEAFKSSLAKLIVHGLIEGDKVEAKKYLSLSSIPAGARLGKNANGEPAYFIEDTVNVGKYIEVGKP